MIEELSTAQRREHHMCRLADAEHRSGEGERGSVKERERMIHIHIEIRLPKSWKCVYLTCVCVKIQFDGAGGAPATKPPSPDCTLVQSKKRAVCHATA